METAQTPAPPFDSPQPDAVYLELAQEWDIREKGVYTLIKPGGEQELPWGTRFTVCHHKDEGELTHLEVMVIDFLQKGYRQIYTLLGLTIPAFFSSQIWAERRELLRTRSRWVTGAWGKMENGRLQSVMVDAAEVEHWCGSVDNPLRIPLRTREETIRAIRACDPQCDEATFVVNLLVGTEKVRHH